jgi:hypothetical protein
MVRWLMCGCLLMAVGGRAWAQAVPVPIGLFAEHADVGTVLHPGSVVYDAAKHSYTIRGSGENVWATADAFQFVWKKMEGDFTLTADISVLGQGGDPHKKAMLMARQSLDADSAYADVALHGVGLTSLQARDAKGADTHEIQSNISAPKRLRLQKYGDEFTMWLAGEDGVFRFSGAAMRVPLTGQFYVGLGVCAHNKDAVETAEFGRVRLEAAPAPAQKFGVLETVAVGSTDRRVTHVGSLGIGAPNWTRDGASLLFSERGRIESISVMGGEPKLVLDRETPLSAYAFQNISPDGTTLAITEDTEDGASVIAVLPIGGGKPRRVTAGWPTSEWPSWSPDGKSILFLGDRGGPLGLYAIVVSSGDEKRLSSQAAYEDAEYSPDGQHIYYASRASGAYEIWRMKPDGSQPEQVTHDGVGKWFPHVSPNGREIAFLTPEFGEAISPLDTAPVALRVLSLDDGKIRVVARFVGDLRSMPVSSWSPDSTRLAFVSYEGLGSFETRRQPGDRGPAVVK